MGKSSENFDDHADEIAANYVNGRFDPQGAQALRANQQKWAEVQARLCAEARTIAQRHRPQQPKAQH